MNQGKIVQVIGPVVDVEFPEHQIPGISRISINPGGTATISVAAHAEPLVCELDLRPSMALMGLGMAYMFAAMQLLM